MAVVKDESQTIGAFLDWLMGEKRCQISCYDDNFYQGEALRPENKSIEQWLAEYFKIDLKKVEEERRQMIDEMREAHQ